MDPISTEAILPTWLSGPQLEKIESNKAKDPLPEIGLKSIKGTT